jgi:hypothetical protein
MGRRGSNLRGGSGGSNLPSAHPPLDLPQLQRRPSMLSWARARIIAYGDGHLSASSAGGPIGAAALPRSSRSQSMMMRVLARGRESGEEDEGGEGAGDASMVRAVDGT